MHGEVGSYFTQKPLMKGHVLTLKSMKIGEYEIVFVFGLVGMHDNHG